MYTALLLRVSLQRIGYNATDDEVNAVCITRVGYYVISPTILKI
jgi:hypothetical protein